MMEISIYIEFVSIYIEIWIGQIVGRAIQFKEAVRSECSNMWNFVAHWLIIIYDSKIICVLY